MCVCVYVYVYIYIYVCVCVMWVCVVFMGLLNQQTSLGGPTTRGLIVEPLVCSIKNIEIPTIDG